MNSFPSKAIVEQLRQRFPAGTRVRLIKMNDDFTNLQPGDEGTVEFCDDAGTLHTIWDCGSTLGLIPDVDQFRIVTMTTDAARLPLLKRRFSRKPVNLEELKAANHTDATRNVIIEKVIELDPERFIAFANDLLKDQDFIQANISLMRMEDDLTCHCILVKAIGADEGVLTESEGHGYARYAAYWDGVEGADND